jgi:hypothetical protein
MPFDCAAQRTYGSAQGVPNIIQRQMTSFKFSRSRITEPLVVIPNTITLKADIDLLT